MTQRKRKGARKSSGRQRAGRGDGASGERAYHRGMEQTLARRFAEVEGDAETCGKRRYQTKGQALAAVGRTANHRDTQGGINGKDGQHRLGVYRCGVCQGRPWHVGHTPSRLRK